MAFNLFKKKEEAPAQGLSFAPSPQFSPQAPQEIPIDSVLALQQQGLSNTQIIETLQRQGYAPQAIYDALSQSQLQTAAPAQDVNSEQFAQMQYPQTLQQTQPQQNAEELVESIVEEKWRELQSQLSKFNDWKENVDSRLDKAEQSLQDTKTDIDNLHKAIVGKVVEYDKNLIDVGTEIKAMEKVFQKVLPDLTGSVIELGRITKAMKTGKK